MCKEKHSLMDWEHRIKTLYISPGTPKLSPLSELIRVHAPSKFLVRIYSIKFAKFAKFKFPKFCQCMFPNFLKS